MITSDQFHASGEPRYLTVKQFHQRHAWPLGGLRHLIFSMPDGFEQVIRRVGRKVLLNEQAFFDWVEKINADKARRRI